MKKPEDLRRHLETSVPCLKKNPENLHVFVEKGTIVSRIGGGMSFMYRYTVNLVVTDFADHADTLAIPLLAWVQTNQPEILQNPEKQETAIRMEAEILDHGKADISIEIDLTESVVVIRDGDRYLAEHIAEPELPDLTGPTGWELYVNGIPIDQL